MKNFLHYHAFRFLYSSILAGMICFAERIEAYWVTAARASAKPAPVARTGNVIAFGEAGAASRRVSG